VLFGAGKKDVNPKERAMWGDLMALGMVFPIAIVLGFFLGRWLGGVNTWNLELNIVLFLLPVERWRRGIAVVHRMRAAPPLGMRQDGAVLYILAT